MSESSLKTSPSCVILWILWYPVLSILCLSSVYHMYRVQGVVLLVGLIFVFAVHPFDFCKKKKNLWIFFNLVNGGNSGNFPINAIIIVNLGGEFSWGRKSRPFLLGFLLCESPSLLPRLIGSVSSLWSLHVALRWAQFWPFFLPVAASELWCQGLDPSTPTSLSHANPKLKLSPTLVPTWQYGLVTVAPQYWWICSSSLGDQENRDILWMYPDRVRFSKQWLGLQGRGYGTSAPSVSSLPTSCPETPILLGGFCGGLRARGYVPTNPFLENGRRQRCEDLPSELHFLSLHPGSSCLQAEKDTKVLITKEIAGVKGWAETSIQERFLPYQPSWTQTLRLPVRFPMWRRV